MSTKAIKGAGPIKPPRRTKQQIEQLNQQIYNVLREDNPQSIRHSFYRMTDPRLPESVHKTQNGYKQIGSRITALPRPRVIPYSWIADMSRSGFHVHTYDGVSDFLERVAGLYRGDLWQYAGAYVEVWVESRSIAGVVMKDCRELAVSLYPSGGFTSITFAYGAAMQINNYVKARNVPVRILYIGDYDPAGVLIDVKIEEELRRHLDPAVDMEFRRIGITPEQIVQYDLPTKPRKDTDNRSLHIAETVEAEAMPAGIMRQLLRDAINEYLPQQALASIKVVEKSERQIIRMLAQRAGGEQ